MPLMGVRTGTGHHDPAALTVAGMRVRLMRGAELQRLHGLREGYSVTSAMPKPSAIAVGKASGPSGHGRQRRLRL